MATNTPRRWMIYGANGYTGRLIVEEAVAMGHAPVLAGRDRAKVEAVAAPHELEVRAFRLDDTREATRALDGIELVVHAAGPFEETAAPMRQLCLGNRAHYVDITGEIEVIEATLAEDRRAAAAGTCFMSGAGFDVIPSDCLARALAEKLPEARELSLAFAAEAGVSRGTARTIVRNLPTGARLRKDGVLVSVPLASESRTIPFDDRPREAMLIAWGDLATAFVSTRIPDIRCYAATPRSSIRWIRWTRPFHGLLGRTWVKDRLEAWVDANVHGPDEEQRRRCRSHLWGEVVDAGGTRVSATLVTPEGYRMTALGAVETARRMLAGDLAPGAWTPAQAFGARFILDFPDTRLEFR